MTHNRLAQNQSNVTFIAKDIKQPTEKTNNKHYKYNKHPQNPKTIKSPIMLIGLLYIAIMCKTQSMDWSTIPDDPPHEKPPIFSNRPSAATTQLQQMINDYEKMINNNNQNNNNIIIIDPEFYFLVPNTEISKVINFFDQRKHNPEEKDNLKDPKELKKDLEELIPNISESQNMQNQNEHNERRKSIGGYQVNLSPSLDTSRLYSNNNNKQVGHEGIPNQIYYSNIKPQNMPE